MLLQKNLIKKEDVAELKKEISSTGDTLEEVLLKRKLIEAALLFQTKSEAVQIELRSVVPDEVSLKTLELIPEDSVKYYKMVPLGLKERVLEVGMVYPEDQRGQEALQFLARRGNFS